jgi:hypothetical protein
MSEHLKYGIWFLGMGITSLYIGLKLRKPTWIGGFVRKYTLIIIGFFCIISGLLFLFGVIKNNG